jgi:hypothetical protein
MSDNISTTKPGATTISSRRSRLMIVAIGMGVVAGMVGIIVYFVGGPQSLSLPSDFDLFQQEGDHLDGSHTWASNGKGLELMIVNALEDHWHTYLNQSIQQWDNGSPDSLTLSTRMSGSTIPDMDCAPMTGLLKVCNGNYGRTAWKGINHAFFDNTGHIYASTAQMNEYFLSSSASHADKQYTMCHELGHGFGLDHTDENLYNINQGKNIIFEIAD